MSLQMDKSSFSFKCDHKLINQNFIIFTFSNHIYFLDTASLKKIPNTGYTTQSVTGDCQK